MSKIDDILKEAKKKGIDKEIQSQILKLNDDKEALQKKNNRLQIEKSKSRAEQYKKSNENYRKKNKKLSEALAREKRKKSDITSHINKEQLGVYNRMITDFELMKTNQKISFPGNDHPIFSRFLDLANQYPNRDFIVTEITKEIKKKIKNIRIQIQAQEKNIKILEECNDLIEKYPDTWGDEVSDEAKWLYTVTNVNELKEEIDKLHEIEDNIKQWGQLKNSIKEVQQSDIKIKNNLYYNIMNEFNRVFDFCNNNGSIYQYKANIVVDSFDKVVLTAYLCNELEKQVSLCEEPYSHSFFYNNGEGRLIPYILDREFMRYIKKNTTFIKQTNKGKSYRDGSIISSKMLFEEAPLYCSTIQYKNDSLVGFNNCFYDIENYCKINLNPQAPIMPLKNTKTELYLKEEHEIEDNPMKQIFNECFSEEDRKTFLAYIGCALFDKGYTQRQESLYLMGKGGTGKSTLIKAITSIFYNVGHQLVSKFKTSNDFGFSIFTNSDVVVMDEIQSAPKEFTNRIKEISTTNDLPIETKFKNTFAMPAENIPRIFFIGNNFSKSMYEESDNEGVKRRILIIKPTKPIQSLGKTYNDLIQPSCQQWIVQNALEEYKKQGLNKTNKPISSISDEEKEIRLTKFTFPEEYFVKEHFEIAYIDNNNIDNNEKISYNDLFDFVRKCIDDDMLESTCKKTSVAMFIKIVKDAIDAPQGYSTQNISGERFFPAIVPSSTEAIEYLSKR